MEGKALLSINNIYKSYKVGDNSIDVLSGLSLSMHRGESLAIVGASGIGKSTLLNIMGTIDRPDQGEYLFAGRNVFTLGDDDLAAFRNSNLGFVFQAMYLLQEFTALENVLIPALISKIKFSTAKEQAMELLKAFKLENRKNHKPSQLSGGEKQRVAIARAIINKPKLILADEPTGNLDEKNANAVIEILSKLNIEFSLSLILVTHNIHLAKRMNIVYSLEKGHLKRLQ